MDVLKPCTYCGQKLPQLAVLTKQGPFCNEQCIRRYINMVPTGTLVVTVTTVTPNATCSVEFVKDK